MPRLGKPTTPRNMKAIGAVVGGLVAFAVLGYLLVISPQRSRASKLTTEIAAKQQELQTATIASHVKPQVDPRVDELFRLTKAMPASADMPGILLELSRVAEDTGISFDSITPATPVAAGAYQSMAVSVAFHGNYYELSDFLFRLNNLVEKHEGKLDVGGRLYAVDGIDFSQGEGSALAAQISATAYIYGAGGGAAGATPDPAASTAPAAGTPPATSTPPATTPPATTPPAGGTS